MIANLERNELKNRNLELEEQLVAKKIALKDISKENAELKSKVDYLLQTTQGGHALEQFESSKEIDNLKKTLNNLQSTVDDLQKENGQLRKRIEEYKGLGRSESSQVEDLKAELMTRQVTVAELNQQNENLSEEVDTLKMKLNDSLMENLRMKENDLQQLRIENEQQRVRIKSLENGLNQSKEQLSEFHKILQIKDQELYQLSNVKAYSETLRQNIAELNKQLIQKNQEMQMVCQERDQKLWQASQEVTRLQQILIDKEKDSENGACDMQTVQEYESKISEVMGQLVEKDRALETMKNQLTQMMNQQKRGEEEVTIQYE